MSDISSNAAAAREAARQGDGKFGAQENAEAPTTDLTGAPEPLQLDEWVEDGDVRLAFTDIGEGYEGDYDQNDIEDERLLRVDVQVRAGHPEAGDPEDETGEWCWLRGTSSWCTEIRADYVSPEDLRGIANRALGTLVGAPPAELERRVGELSGLSDEPPASMRVVQDESGGHLRVADGKPGYTCPDCGNGYATQAVLDVHMTESGCNPDTSRT